MKQQLGLVALAQEIERQKTAKRDFIAPSPALAMATDGQRIMVPGANEPGLSAANAFALRDHAHSQLAARLDIPKRYYDRMREEAPELLASNVNNWLAESKDRRMVRTLDGTVRAILSDRYQRIENEEIAEVALPILAGQPDITIESCAITETRLYIKAVFPRIQGEVAVGDVMQAGVVISNSEVGSGAVSVAPLLYRLVCKNGMIRADERFRGFHVGGRAQVGENVYEMLTDETRKADDRAVLLKLRDVVKAAADPAYFTKALERMREAATEKLGSKNVVEVVEQLATRHRLVESEKSGVLQHLIEGGDLSRWGLVNAVTRASQDVESYDRATELETLGGVILDLPRNQWRELAQAA